MNTAPTDEGDKEQGEGSQVAQARQHNTAVLQSLLRYKNETLAKAKAELAVTQYKLQCELHEFEQLKQQLESPAAQLTDLRDKLSEDAKLKHILASQIATEVQNTEKIANVLTEHDQELARNYELKLQSFVILEEKYRKCLEGYTFRRENLGKVIKDKKVKLIQMIDEQRNDQVEWERIMNAKLDEIRRMDECNKATSVSFEEHKQILAKLQNEYDNDVSSLNNLNEDCRLAQNLLTCKRLETEQVQAMTAQISEDNSKKRASLGNELKEVAEKLGEAKKMEAAVQKRYGDRCKETKKLEDALKKLDGENSELNAEEKELARQRQKLAYDADVELNDLKRQYEALSFQHEKLRETQYTIKLQKDTKLKMESALDERIAQARRTIDEYTELKNKREQDLVTYMLQKEGFVQSELSLKSEIDQLHLSIPAIRTTLSHSQAAHDQCKADIDLKISIAYGDLQDRKNKCKANERKLESELDNYKHEQQKVYNENEDGYKESLAELTNEHAARKTSLDEEKSSICKLDALIAEQKQLHAKYHNDLKHLKTSKENKTPASILKSPGKASVSPKKVTFEVKATDTESECASQSITK